MREGDAKEIADLVTALNLGGEVSRPPAKTGEIAFVCGMNRLRGTVIVD
jgi:plastocyanin domain-containing protein